MTELSSNARLSPGAAPPADSGQAAQDRLVIVVGLYVAALMLGAEAYAAWNRGINWDEFHHYDLLTRLDDGTLGAALQTFSMHFFRWVLDMPGEVTDHIRIIRLVTLLFTAGAALALFGVARKFGSRTAAILIALTYLSGGYVVMHGAAFRADPIAACFLMSAMWVFACRPLKALGILLSGALAALALVVTIKSVFYAPAFAAIAWLRIRQSERKGLLALQMLACLIACFVIFAGLFTWHGTHLASAPATAAKAASASVSSGLGTVKSAWSVVFSEGLLPQARALKYQIFLAPHITALFLITLWYWRRLDVPRSGRIAMVGLLLPLATVLFYRNSYEYYFVFLLPPVLVALTPAMDQVFLRKLGFGKSVALMLVLALALAFLRVPVDRQILASQRQVNEVARTLFPDPKTTYLDFSGHLGDYDRAMHFMLSGWGLTGYRRAGRAQLTARMETRTIPLLIANHRFLEAAVTGVSTDEHFLTEDTTSLRENYIHHWGIIFVAGRVIPAGAAPDSFDNLVPGIFTVEDNAVRIDGTLYRPGDLVTLQRGRHEIGGDRAGPAVLRWGDHLAIPDEEPLMRGPFQPLWIWP